jgi:hypothetical protein
MVRAPQRPGVGASRCVDAPRSIDGRASARLDGAGRPDFGPRRWLKHRKSTTSACAERQHRRNTDRGGPLDRQPSRGVHVRRLGDRQRCRRPDGRPIGIASPVRSVSVRLVWITDRMAMPDVVHSRSVNGASHCGDRPMVELRCRRGPAVGIGWSVNQPPRIDAGHRRGVGDPTRHGVGHGCRVDDPNSLAAGTRDMVGARGVSKSALGPASAVQTRPQSAPRAALAIHMGPSMDHAAALTALERLSASVAAALPIRATPTTACWVTRRCETCVRSLVEAVLAVLHGI